MLSNEQLGQDSRFRSNPTDRFGSKSQSVLFKISNIDLYSFLEILQNRAALEAQAIDFEKPGLAQHYCVECAKSVFPKTTFQLALSDVDV